MSSHITKPMPAEPARAPREGVGDTAVITASGRAATDILYAGKAYELFKVILRREGAETGPADIELMEALGRGMASQVEARHLLMNHLLAQSGVTQILEVASGLSTRGVYMTEASDEIKYVELDLPGMMGVKREIVRGLTPDGKRPHNLHLVAGNALDLDDIKKAVSAGNFDPKKPIAVINEGLMRYLSFPQKMQFAENVKTVLTWFGGLWITPDITLRNTMKIEDELNNSQNLTLKQMSGVNIYFNAFESVQQGMDFFTRQGFVVKVHPYLEVKSQLVSPERVGMSKRKSHEMIKEGVVAVMRLPLG